MQARISTPRKVLFVWFARILTSDCGESHGREIRVDLALRVPFHLHNERSQSDGIGSKEFSGSLQIEVIPSLCSRFVSCGAV